MGACRPRMPGGHSRVRPATLPHPLPAMKLDVLLFASYRELVGEERVSVELEDGATVARLVEILRAREGGFSRLPERPAVAVNQAVVPHGHPLEADDEVALLPPVAGG